MVRCTSISDSAQVCPTKVKPNLALFHPLTCWGIADCKGRAGRGGTGRGGTGIRLCSGGDAGFGVGERPSFFQEKDKMLAAYFDCPGGPENLYVKQVMKPHPGEGEVLVKVSASALNRADLLQAAAIPEAWLTAFQLLHFVGKVQKDERVLIHAGASGVGMAAIQLVRLAKAIPIVTAGTQEKLKATAKAGAAAGFNYKNEDFSEKVLAFTQGSGVDIILDCVGGSYWEKNLNCLSTDGRWIIYGLLSGGEVHGDLLARLLSKRASIHTSLLRSRDKEYKERLVKAFTEDALPYFSGGSSLHLQPFVDSVCPLHEIAEAHRIMEENKNIGKIVIKMPASS
ncbi:quinone oxidoreductase PIG3 isoform X2 [Falco naumanni]|uniref:quinone oxidoreductase PIG3 isoform X2 n=1 Tax=Falco naumanni TaxID=148594 RepID=UPI001ADEA046|nr:quinone oxidoreductase PIG3 isoform X2 [Falco naumanni]